MDSLIKGKIIKGVGGLYSVEINRSGPSLAGLTVHARARGNFRHAGMTPLVGDNVTLIPDTSGGADISAERDFVIDAIDDRKNALIRPPLANLDYLFVTMAAAAPIPILPTVDKLTCIAVHNGIEPVIVITKQDLNAEYASQLSRLYTSCGFTCFEISAKEGSGIADVKDFISQNLAGKTAAFAGASGIGKSTLMNALFPDLHLGTGDISKKVERGKHTTREVTLFSVDDVASGGYIADTPGFSMLDFKRFDFFEKHDLVHTMPELAPFTDRCRYKKCTHTKEEGCAVLEAVRDGIIPRSRHESYVELYYILKTRNKWE